MIPCQLLVSRCPVLSNVLQIGALYVFLSEKNYNSLFKKSDLNIIILLLCDNKNII